MKKFLLAFNLLLASTLAFAQNPTCPNRPANDNSNACANTRYVTGAIGGPLGTMARQNANSVAITGGTITGMPLPIASADVANKIYVDNIASGLNVLAPSTLATAAVLPNTPTYVNGTLGVGATLTAGSNTTLTVDGTAAPLNTIVLVKNQAAPAQNGIYSVTTAGSGAAPWVLTRATYFDQAAEMKANSYTFISSGATNANTSYTLQTAVTTVGTDPLNWVQFSGGSNVIAGAGISVTPSGPNRIIANTISLVSVADAAYGARCDGSTDDTAAIQAAMNATPVGGTLYIPPSNVYSGGGQYIGGCLITSTLTVPHPMNITGSGMYSNIKTDPSFPAGQINIYVPEGGTYWEGIKFSNFALGVDMTAEPYIRYGGKGIFVDGPSVPRFRFENLFIGESGNDYSLVINGPGTQQDIVRDSKIYGGLFFNNTADSQTVEHNFFGGRSTLGVRIDMPGAGQLTFINNVITAVGGIYISGVSLPNIQGNYIEELSGFPFNMVPLIGRNALLALPFSVNAAYIAANIFNMGQSTGASNPLFIGGIVSTTVVGNEFNNSANGNSGSIYNTSSSLICGPNMFLQSNHVVGGGSYQSNYGAC